MTSINLDISGCSRDLSQWAGDVEGSMSSLRWRVEYLEHELASIKETIALLKRIFPLIDVDPKSDDESSEQS